MSIVKKKKKTAELFINKFIIILKELAKNCMPICFCYSHISNFIDETNFLE